MKKRMDPNDRIDIDEMALLITPFSANRQTSIADIRFEIKRIRSTQCQKLTYRWLQLSDRESHSFSIDSIMRKTETHNYLWKRSAVGIANVAVPRKNQQDP